MGVINRFSGEYAFLSNFYPSPIEYASVEYPTVEHAFQAAKTFDPEERQQIWLAPTPSAAKRLGRQVVLRRDWEQAKDSIMHTLLSRKFPDPEVGLGERLVATGDAYLEEGNTWGDRYWGTVNGQGLNRLGELLMQVRAELRGER